MKQRYDSYKPSGIDWIGDIPTHWEVIKLKHLIRMKSGASLPPEKIDPTDGFYPVFGGNGIRGFTSDFNNEGEYVLIGRQGALCGNINYTYDKFWVTEHAVVCYPLKFLAIFWLGELLRTMNLNRYNVSAAQPGLAIERIKELLAPVPPIHEQVAIAAWLDNKCGEIDAAIAKVDREIELIDELKQSEISRVVTRGLNPDTPLRPSGIDWIGDIPEHWTKCRLKFIGSARNGLTYSPSDVKDSGKLVIRSSNIQDSKLNYDDCVFVANYPETLSVNSGDTIICSRNGSINLIGKSVFIEDDMDVTFGAFMMRFRPYEHPKYSHYLLSIAISRYKGLFATTTINQLTADSLGKMEAVMPPYMEQVQIADYLDKKCAAIDGLKAKLIKKRETLTELRQSIISEVVTGKRKVI